jgi:YegS/Rv2252/BmrU family lipid kinase
LLKNAGVQARGKRGELDIALIVNPNSHGGMTGMNWDQIHAEIEKIFGSGVRVAFSKKHGNGTVLARDLLRRGFGSIIAVGGDGTVNEVANGFFEETTGAHGSKLRPINPDAVMGIVPCGTRNLVAKSLGLPVDVIKCCQNFVTGSPAKIDVIAVSATDQDDGSRLPPRIFLNAAEMGVGAEIIDRSKKVRKRVKSRLVSTVAAIISTVPSYESNSCDLFIDGRKKSVGMTMGVVANGKFLGGGFVVAPEASMSDGLLDLVVMKDSGSLKMLGELTSIRTGSYDGKDNMLYSKARKVAIKPRERKVTVMVDGERAGILPATFNVFPKALAVVA